MLNPTLRPLAEARAPLRVLHVLEATGGGTARHVSELIVGLRGRVQSDLVYSLRRGKGFESTLERVKQSGALCIELPMRRAPGPEDLIAVIHLRRMLARRRFDVIHLHSSKAGGIGRLAALGLGRPILYTPHGWSFLCGGRRGQLYLSLERALIVGTTHIVAVSESEARAAVEQVGLKPCSVDVVPNAAPLRGPLRIEPGPVLRLGALGRMVPQKDPLALVRFAGALRATGCAFRLEVGGVGPLIDATRQAIARSGLEEQVHVLGEITDTDAFYQRQDTVVSTSIYEGMPYTILDAMAWGLPTVAFAAPGVVDLIEHDQTGLLAQPGDVVALAKQARRLVEQGLAGRLGLAARARIGAEHAPADQLVRFEALYRSLAERAK